MSNYTAEGVLEEVFDAEKKTDTFTSREFVLRVATNNEQYPNYLKFQLINDRCDLIDAYRNEDEIRVHFNLVGKKWNDKYFVNIQCWKIEYTSKEVSRKPPIGEPKKTEKVDAAVPDNSSYDDLPF